MCKDLELRVPAIWGCELYGPGEINELYAGLQSMGWGLPYKVDDKDGIEDWIRQNRAYGHQGAWLNGGHVIGQREQNRQILNSNRASLPRGVSSLDVEVFQLTPSLTGVLVKFRFDEKAAQIYENEINRERTTCRKRAPRSWSISIIGPRNQKHDGVARVRSDLRRMVAGWYKKHLPGYFSTNNREAAFPIMELLTVKQGPILHQPPNALPGTVLDWRWFLNNEPPQLVWTSQENEAIQLVMGNYRENEQGRFITVAIDSSKFDNESMEMYGGKSTDSIIYACGGALRYILPHTSTMEYLKEQTRYLNINREQLKKARSGRANLSRTLFAIRRFFDQTLGVPALARELVAKSKASDWYHHDIGFTAPGWGSEARRQLSDDIQSSTHVMALRLAEDEFSMRGYFEQLSSILNIHENIKLQHRMQVLTFLALVVAVLSLLVAIAAPNTISQLLKSIWHQLGPFVPV